MDVDGSLTDGRLYIGNDGELFKAFNVKDGCGIHDIVIPKEIEPIIITGRRSQIVANRCQELGITRIYQGVRDKIAKLQEIIPERDWNCTAYFGDDINDLDCMKNIQAAGGVVGCPADAVDEVKNIAGFISSQKGGNGALREFIEWIIYDKPVHDVESTSLHGEHYSSVSKLLSIAVDEYHKGCEQTNMLNNKSGFLIIAIIVILAILAPRIPCEKMHLLTDKGLDLLIREIIFVFLVISFAFIILALADLITVFNLGNYKKENFDNFTYEKMQITEFYLIEVIILRHYRDLISHNIETNESKSKKISAGIKKSTIGLLIMIIITIIPMILMG